VNVRIRLLTVAAGFAALAAVPGRAAADNTGVVQAAPAAPVENNVRIDQRLGARVNLDLVFRDESERPITLREATQGKVTILVPVYFRCPMLCTRVLNGLLDGLRAMPPDFTAGDKFNVVAVSMDPKEHADLGAPKKAHYLAEYGRLDPKNPLEPGWRFLTGKKEPVAELLESVGYNYEFDKAFKEYNHPSGIVILTPDGTISRYFLGIGYDDFDPNQPRDDQGRLIRPPTWNTLRLSLVEASDGKIGTLADQLTLICYRFDHLSQGYALSIMRVVQIGGDSHDPDHGHGDRAGPAVGTPAGRVPGRAGCSRAAESYRERKA
jgi:protein SCO1/2